MKKLFALLVAASCMLSSVAFAASMKVSVPNTEQAVEVTYEETAKSVDASLMVATSVLALTDSKDVAATIKLDSNSDKPVAIKLDMSIPEDKIKSGTTAIDYIGLKIENSDGVIVYEDTQAREKGANNREVVLGIMNEDGKDDSQTYYIYMSAADGIKMTDLVNAPADIVWSINLDADEEVVASVKNSELGGVKGGKTITISVDTATDKDGGKVAAGVYGFTGKGTCTIKSADGTKENTFVLSEDEAKAKYVTVNKGDIITVTGDEDAKLLLLNQKAAASTTSNSSKTNPKTGDTAPITLAAVAAILAMGLMVYAARTKKRED